ncbi:MAG: PTS sugar transporter subunit IIA [Proteobacteria bacterium]|nr:PTS sugar transporter subunit IIA [Pseudomonadota bacterium]
MIELSDILTLDRTVYSAIVHSKKKALEYIAETFCLSIPTLNAHDIFDGLVQRERLGSTAIGHGVAIPHCRLEATTQAYGCFVLLKEGIDFDAEDHQQVDMLFSLIVPMEAHEEHLEFLATLARLFREETFRRQLYQATSRDELYQRLIGK